MWSDLTKPIIPGHRSLIVSMQTDWNMPAEHRDSLEVYYLTRINRQEIAKTFYPNIIIGNGITYVCLFHNMYPNCLRDYEFFNLSFRKHAAFKNGYVMITPDPTTRIGSNDPTI